MNYNHFISWVMSQPWAIMPEKMALIQQFLSDKQRGIIYSDTEIHDKIADGLTGNHAMEDDRINFDSKARPRAGAKGNIAVINLFGVISHRISEKQAMSGGGGTSVEKTQARLRQAVADPSIKAIVLNIDSPGGSVNGVRELADEIFEARNQKHIVAVANSLAASAAYWVATAADELVVTPSGSVGSIGVYTAHEDYSAALEQEGIKVTLISAGKYKVEANPFAPLSEEAKASLQSDVNEFYDMFVDAVARGRGVASRDVRNGFGEGRVVNSKNAKKEGMVDRVATFDQVLASLGASTTPANSSRASLEREYLSLYEN